MVNKLLYTSVFLSLTGLAGGSVIAGSTVIPFQPNIRGIFVHTISASCICSANVTGISQPIQSTLLFSDGDSYNKQISSVFSMSDQVTSILDTVQEYRRIEMSFQNGQDVFRQFDKPLYFSQSIGIALNIAAIGVAWGAASNYRCYLNFAYELARL
jgi:hypothetical protein